MVGFAPAGVFSPTPDAIKLTDVGLALVSLLIARIVVLASRIEWVLSRSASLRGVGYAKARTGEAGERGEQLAPSVALPHVRGVLAEKDALSPRTAADHTAGRLRTLSIETDSACGSDDWRLSEAADHVRAELASGCPPRRPPAPTRAYTDSANPPLDVEALDMPSLDARKAQLPLRRTATVGGEVAGVISPLKRRSSRGAVLHSAAPLPGPGSPAVSRMQAELEALDVLPLTTADEAPLLTRMRIELCADLLTMPSHDDVCGDIRLLRFLRGYAHSVHEACAAYRAMLHTRRQHDVERIRAQVLAQPLVAEEMPHGALIAPLYPMQLNCGLSHRGHLVSVDPIGAIKLRRLMVEVGPSKLFEFLIGVSELRQIIMDELSVETGKLVQSVQVKDLHGLGLAALREPSAIKTLQEIITTCTSMYPESLATLYIINAPFFFPMAWSVVSTFVSERTKKKIHVLGTDYAQVLREDVGAGVLDVIEQLHALSAQGDGRQITSDSPSMRAKQRDSSPVLS
ncbi:hypothetical protein KFE25_012606 [Diacronema lutheri]|uniref:CRAL-TRIO domain-containing protein n=3 Tax=Diacronema lutheri TaxID=2081491 RepID=A0A8J5XE64_DIALT|nr:hypothetical protein KFE25_012606 [Diacronema lutheri]